MIEARHLTKQDGDETAARASSARTASATSDR